MVEEEQEFEEAVEIIGLVEGTVKEMKEHIRKNDFEQEKLEKLLEVEKDSKNRKTAIKFLEKQIDDGRTEAIEELAQEENDKHSSSSEEETTEEAEEELLEDEEIDPEKLEAEDVETDTEIDKETLLQLLGGTVEDVKEYVKEKEPSDQELQEILHAEKTVKDRKTVVKFLKSYSKKKELEEDFRQAEYDFKQMKKDLKKIEEDVMDDSVELNLDSVEVPEPEEDSDAKEESSEDKDEKENGGKEYQEKQPSEEDDIEDKNAGDEEKEDAEEVEEEPESEETDSLENEDEEPDEGDEPSEEEKKQLAEELGLDMSDEELKAVSMESLEQIKKEKQEREELIESLKGNFDEEKLRDASTSDLRKLKEGLSQKKESKTENLEEEEKVEKDQEKKDAEIREEAEEDLEMLMGAVKSKNSGSSDDGGMVKNLKSSITDTQNQVKGLLKRGDGDEDESDDNGMKDEDVLELLEQYRKLEPKEASIKIAHVMKGYLEYEKDIKREMTYKELADELRDRGVESQSLDKLLDFFHTMNKAQYTGHIDSNVDEVVDAAEQTVKEMN